MLLLDSKKSIIFDMDGVLLLSSDLHEFAFKTVCEKYSLSMIAYSEISGMKTDEAFGIILEKNETISNAEFIKVLVREKQILASNLLKENPPIAENCFNIIKTLSKTHSLCLASSSRKKNVELFLNTSNTKEFFSIVLSGDDVIHSKPNPEIFIKALHGLSQNPEKCIVVEDSAKGILAAKNANIEVIGIAKDNLVSIKLKESGAAHILKSIGEIFTLTKDYLH